VLDANPGHVVGRRSRGRLRRGRHEAADRVGLCGNMQCRMKPK
jgi:hypothetical protein